MKLQEAQKENWKSKQNCQNEAKEDEAESEAQHAVLFALEREKD